MRILIIANARYKGGSSGSDEIFLHFAEHWPVKDITIQSLMLLDYKPFWLCYLHRIAFGIKRALLDKEKYDFVYSASDFWADSLPAFIYKIKGNKWVAGFYLFAPKNNWIYRIMQMTTYDLIKRHADMVIVANPGMYYAFKNKKKTWINGGVDLKWAGLSGEPKVFDAVFCGRIHRTKGIDELIDIWGEVRKWKPDASLALIGDGDLGKKYIMNKLIDKYGSYIGITFYGYMGNERFDIYKKSKIVLYPARFNHFSMMPVEAMACGCPMVAFQLPVIFEMIKSHMIAGCVMASNMLAFSGAVLYLIKEKDDEYEVNYKFDNVAPDFASLSNDAYISAQGFDYKKQSLRVWDDICAVINQEGIGT